MRGKKMLVGWWRWVDGGVEFVVTRFRAGEC